MKLIEKMWISYILIIVLVGHTLSANVAMVELSCIEGCMNNTKGVVALVGKDIVLRYTVDDRLCVLDVKYNGKLIISTYEPHLCRLDVRAVIGRDPRLKFITDLIRVRNTFVYDFMLTNVSIINDNGSKFEYVTDLRDANGKNVTGYDVVTIKEPPKPTKATVTQVNTGSIISSKLNTTMQSPEVSTKNSTTVKSRSNVINTTINTTAITVMIPDFETTTSTNDSIVVIQASAAKGGDEYPWATVIGIICGAIFIILFVIAVVLAIRCKRDHGHHRYASARSEGAVSSYEEEFVGKKPVNGTIKNGGVDYQPILAEIEQGESNHDDSKTNGVVVSDGEPNGTIANDAVYAEIEQGGCGQPQLVYAAAEVDEDRPRFASINNQPHLSIVVEQSEDSQTSENNSVSTDVSPTENNNEPPYVAIIRNKPPSDIIEPPSDEDGDSAQQLIP